MNMAVNRFKEAIAAGSAQLGLWSSLCSPIGAEIIAGAGFDWILFDTEHAPVEIAGVLPLLQAAASGTAETAVRPAWNDRVLIKRVLDIGARTVLLPFVENADEARAAVAACRYPPDGVRGVAGSTRASRFGRDREYLRNANRTTCILVQVETGVALGNLEEIAEVEGVDGVFIGPSDLAASLGHVGAPGHAEVQDAIRDAQRRIAGCGKPAGILAVNPDDAQRYLDWGYVFVAAGVDNNLLARGADDLLSRLKG